MDNIDKWLEEGVYSVLELIGQPASANFIAETFDMLATEKCWLRFSDKDRLKLVRIKISKLVKSRRFFVMEYRLRSKDYQGEKEVFGLRDWLNKDRFGILCKGKTKFMDFIVSED